MTTKATTPTEETNAPEFVITRVFDAPRDLVFKACTESEQLAQWWGPKGFALRVCHLDVRPGGSFHYCMTAPGGQEMWGKFVYREVTAPERIVYTSSFADAEGNIIRSPFGTFPLEILNSWTLTEDNGRTTLTARGTPYVANDPEREAFEGMFASMQKGFGGTFDQLVDYLAKVQRTE